MAHHLALAGAGESPLDASSLTSLAQKLLGLAATLGPAQPPAAPTTPLAKLLGGVTTPEDLLRLGAPVQGGRLLVGRIPRSEAVLRDLGTTRLPHAWMAGELAVLVPSRRAAEALASRLQRLAPGNRLGVSSTLRAAEDLPRALDEARRAERLCLEDVAFAEDSWTDLVMDALRDHVADSLTLDNPLRRLDEVKPEFRSSFESWLRHDGDVQAAAEEMCVHPNTLRYRVRRVQEITGGDLEDPAFRLVARLLLT